jgi:hypothetical protein
MRNADTQTQLSEVDPLEQMDHKRLLVAAMLYRAIAKKRLDEMQRLEQRLFEIRKRA